jgi:hypothetical protein
MKALIRTLPLFVLLAGAASAHARTTTCMSGWNRTLKVESAVICRNDAAAVDELLRTSYDGRYVALEELRSKTGDCGENDVVTVIERPFLAKEVVSTTQGKTCSVVFKNAAFFGSSVKELKNGDFTDIEGAKLYE